MRVLVTYGSKRGGTAGVAEMVAAGLRQAGLAAEVLAASAVRDVRAYDAVVVGGALYAGRWQTDARRFVRRNAAVLAGMPVWFFSSGPLDDSAGRAVIAPTPQVAGLIRKVGARGHVTFGGRLAPDARGFPASAMARTHAGDWRDPGRIGAWAREVADALGALPVGAGAAPGARAGRSAAAPGRALRRLLAGLCLFTAVTALGGGLALVVRPDGALVRLPVSALRGSPFHDYLIPGLLLAGAVGLGNLVAGILVLARSARAHLAATVAGCALVGWMAGELVFVASSSWLQVLYLVVGGAILVAALSPWQRPGLPPGSFASASHSRA